MTTVVGFLLAARALFFRSRSATGRASGDSAASRHARRSDIQWLRALAVGSVVAYHLEPRFMPGGYVGVDVFFVISGFLITGGLIRHPPGDARKLAEFWNRRIRRLLPASFAVLALCAPAALLLTPMTQLPGTLRSAAASTLYAQNWNLSWEAVDYLASTQAPTVFQHFWSLSVEEQFYLVWPLLFFALARLESGRGIRRKFAAAAAVGLVVVCSLAYSLYLTGVNPAAAYFSTFTRGWELGAGGLLAVASARLDAFLTPRPAMRTALKGFGAVAMLAAGFCFGDTTPFPGGAALLPTLGAASFIAGGKSAFDAFLSWRPFQWVGDISYSIYLWHWPVAVWLPAALARYWPAGIPRIRGAADVIVLILTFGIAALSYHLIEEKLRGPRPLGDPPHRGFVFLAAGSLLICACTGSGWWMLQRKIQSRLDVLARAVPMPCVGAGALGNEACAAADPHGTAFLVTPEVAALDRSDAYEKGCLWEPGSERFPTCLYGRRVADRHTRRIGLFGNSHAVQWLPGLSELADGMNVQVSTYLSSGCFPALLRQKFDDPADERRCLSFTADVMERVIDSGVRVLVISSFTEAGSLIDVPPGERYAAAVDSYRRIIERFVSAGVAVLVIRDTPFPGKNIPDCLAGAETLSACDGPRSAWVRPDPLFDAARTIVSPLLVTADLTDVFCDAGACLAVLGGLVPYFDGSHVSATFSRTAARHLAPALARALDGEIRGQRFEKTEDREPHRSVFPPSPGA
ncbi:MAG: acyltransferase, partial [Candidatus Accumulibacter sp.]|nr:acyltransferase [Accumulibacter sp.]